MCAIMTGTPLRILKTISNANMILRDSKATNNEIISIFKYIILFTEEQILQKYIIRRYRKSQRLLLY